ncbi:MAG: fimbrillin family protein, partial [Muribaculaceae bacterium]|nr:fimbrillin family protein [Muribaculaceae bacterium]
MKHLHISFLSFLLALLIPSCSDEIKLDNSRLPLSDEINFSVSSDWNETESSRSTPENDSNATCSRILKDVIPIPLGNSKDSLFLQVFEESISSQPTDTRGAFQEGLYTDMSITGYRFDHSTGWDGNASPEFMYDVKYQESDGYYKVPEGNQKYSWPGKESDLRFYSIMPYGAGTLSSSTTKGEPSFTYTIPNTVTQQQELFIGKSTDIQGDIQRRTPIKLDMERALTSVRFEESDDLLDGTIKTIRIKNVYGGGIYRFEDNSWETSGDPRNFEVDVNQNVPTTSGNPITTSLQNFFLIPQSLPTEASIEIVFSPFWTTTGYTISAPLRGTLEAAKSYVYRLATSNEKYEDDFSITAPETLYLTDNKTKANQIGTLTITSTEKFMQGDKVISSADLQWTAKFYEYNPDTDKFDIPLSQAPSWLEGMPTSGTGSKSYTLTNKRTPVDNATKYNNILKTAPERGTADHPWNLANSTGAETDENTANSYIVNAPGTYSIPLAYGNTIKNGKFNPALTSLKNDSNVSYLLNKNPVAMYTNKDGRQISKTVTSPYIYDLPDDGPSPQDYIGLVLIRWQDKTNLITNAKLSDDHKRIIFTLNRTNIEQGNAFISVLSAEDRGDAYLWGWHIWVTHYEPGVGDKTVTDKNGNQTIFMPYNLGWVDNSKVYTEEKPVRIEITQTLTDKKVDCILRFPEQSYIEGHSVTWLDGNPFPQFSTRNTKNLFSYTDETPSIQEMIGNLNGINYASYKIEYTNLWDYGKDRGYFADCLKYEYIK